MPTTPFYNLSNEAWGLTKIITNALTTKEIASLTTTCIALLHLFGPCLKKHAFDYFLQCIAYGEQSKAEAILRQHPDFLLKAGSVTDYSERTFKNITAFQLACWYKDRHMSHMLCTATTPDQAIKNALLVQYRALQEKGIAYTFKSPIIYQLGERAYSISGEKNSQAYCIQALFDAYQYYLDHYDRWERTANWQAMEHYWCHIIGLLQRLLPPHFIHEICYPNRSFDTEPSPFEGCIPSASFRHLNFTEKHLPRTSKFYSHEANRVESLFPLRFPIHQTDNINFALIRGPIGLPVCTDVTAGGVNGGRFYLNTSHVTGDLYALEMLDNIRSTDIEDIAETLTENTHTNHVFTQCLVS